MTQLPTIEAFIRKFERLGPLSSEERQVLDSVPIDPRPVAAGQVLVAEGSQPGHCLLLLQGFACRYKALDGGGRQILAFLLPGDLCDLNSLMLPQMDHGIATITPALVTPVAHHTIAGWLQEHPGLRRALWRDGEIDASIFREWIVNVGRRTPTKRVAHLLCELAARMATAGVPGPQGCAIPVGQADLAAATSLSPVNVNRGLQDLEEAGLVHVDGGGIVVRDWAGLVEAAAFSSRYLHQLAPAPAPALG